MGTETVVIQCSLSAVLRALSAPRDTALVLGACAILTTSEREPWTLWWLDEGRRIDTGLDDDGDDAGELKVEFVKEGRRRLAEFGFVVATSSADPACLNEEGGEGVLDDEVVDVEPYEGLFLVLQMNEAVERERREMRFFKSRNSNAGEPIGLGDSVIFSFSLSSVFSSAMFPSISSMIDERDRGEGV